MANVKTLLQTHFGENWEDLDLKWYEILFDNTRTDNHGGAGESDNEEEPTDDNEECDCLDEEKAINI